MIARPTTPQLIDGACVEITNRVMPLVTEPTAKVVLEMAVAVLQGAANRAASEQAWMREEADAIEAVASRFVDELPDAGALASALRAYTEAKTDSRYLADAQADYERASEVLSCAAEAAYASADPERIAAVKGLLDQRMANEKAVIGTFLAAGRAD